LLLPLDPVTFLLDGLVDGIVRKAFAESGAPGSRPRNHVFIGLAGAPPRWYFDLPLAPYRNANSARFDPRNSSVVTRFKAPAAGANRVSEAEYADAYIRTPSGSSLWMPHLWSSSIAVSDGQRVVGTRAMSELLDHFVMIRGIAQIGDGHGFLHGKMLRPDPSGPSLHGLVADASDRTVPAVGLNAGGDSSSFFKAPRGTSLTQVDSGGSNPLDSVLGVFSRQRTNGFGTNGPVLNRRQLMEQLMGRALDTLGAVARSSHPEAAALHESRSRAESLLARGIGDIATEYPRLLAKYEGILGASVDFAGRPPLAGITDRIISTERTAENHRYNRSSIAGGTTLLKAGGDLRDILKPTQFNGVARFPMNAQLAPAFAIIEYLLVHGYSSAISVSLGGTNGLRTADAGYFSSLVAAGSQEVPIPLARPNLEDRFQDMDEHQSTGGGRHVSLLLNSIFFHGLMGCISELIRALGADVFRETVIQLTSEFSRQPHVAGWGSEHAPTTAVTSLISGAIRSPLVIGNVKSGTAGDFQGHYGRAQPNRIAGSTSLIGVGHVASSVAHLLRVPSPVTNSPSLVREADGGVESVVEGVASETEVLP